MPVASLRNMTKWKSYADAITQFKKYKPDLVLVDGRWRFKACALQAFIQIKNESLTVFIHDFYDRKYYHQILNESRMVDCADTLILLRCA